jgi:uncharacterized integral membrane protein (TIGR00698 family)
VIDGQREPDDAGGLLTAGMRAVTAVVPGLVVVSLLAALAFVLADWASLSPLVVGVGLGAIVANTYGVPPAWAPGVRFGARTLLRIGIVVLGLRLPLGDLVALGLDGLVVIVLIVAITFLGTQWLARRLGIGRDLGLLVATGYSICGASAIAAVNGVVHADEEETAYAITLVTICGTLSIFVLPFVGERIGLSGETFGAWVGASVHDVGQVVATASTGGSAALDAATVVKLTRVVLLAPLVALVSMSARRRRPVSLSAASNQLAIDQPPPLLPLFAIGFLGAMLLRSTGILSAELLDVAATAEKILLTVALVSMGMGVRLAQMRRLGVRPLGLGLLAWLLVAAVAYVGTLVVV